MLPLWTTGAIADHVAAILRCCPEYLVEPELNTVIQFEGSE